MSQIGQSGHGNQNLRQRRAGGVPGGEGGNGPDNDEGQGGDHPRGQGNGHGGGGGDGDGGDGDGDDGYYDDESYDSTAPRSEDNFDLLRNAHQVPNFDEPYNDMDQRDANVPGDHHVAEDDPTFDLIQPHTLRPILRIVYK